MRHLFFTLALVLSISKSEAQQCIVYTQKEKLLQEHPEFKESISIIESQFNQENKTPVVQQRTANECYTYVIPVVFHILHNNGTENLSDQVIFDQVRRLNIDFNKQNADTSIIEPEFISIAANAEIEFRLAKKDPQGNATSGIIRYQTMDTFDPDANVTLGRQWPREKYMNIYVMANVGTNVAGYTYLPVWVDGWPQGDAVFMRYNYLNGDSRVLTHEVGHWLNLDHCWGPTNDPGLASNCNYDDDVFDTPNTVGWTSCNLQGASCGSSKDNVQNYMEYTYCNTMFTQGQASRMHTTLNSSIAQRNNLWQEANLIATGVNDLTEANFSASKRIVCIGEQITLYDLSTYGPCSWTWSITGPENFTSNEAMPQLSFTIPGSYSVSLVASNSQGSVNKTEVNYLEVINSYYNYLPFSEGFENNVIPDSNWMVEAAVSPWIQSNLASNSGMYSAMVNNYAQASGYTSTLISKGVDLSVASTAVLTFKVAYAQKILADNDMLRVLFSADCGESWTIRWGKTGGFLKTSPPTPSVFVPNSTEWASYQININSQYLNENFLFQFDFKSGGGNNIYIDDINLSVAYLDYPILSTPLNLETSVSSNVMLDWKAVDTADYYEYYLDTNNQFNSPLFISGTEAFISTYPHGTDTRFLTNNLVPNTTYYWKVRTNTSGINSPWSNTWSFTTDQNTWINPKQETKNLFSVFPSLTSDLIAISSKELASFTIEIHNIEGAKMIQQKAHSETTLSLKELSPGMYIISIYKEGVLHHNQKIIKQ